MDWLWLISVGESDVQFPVWEKDENNEWTRLRRFRLGRAGIRAVHEALLALLRAGQIRFEAGLPKAIGGGPAPDLQLEFDQEGETFRAAYRQPDYRISREADTLPNERESKLTLYCPKVEPLLPLASAAFASNRVTVVVLNTRRAERFSEAALEPVASGPLVSKCLGERLGLRWVDDGGQLPGGLAPGTSTWFDFLTGEEAMEDSTVQRGVVDRLRTVIRAWGARAPGGRQIAITISGGMGPLKPIIERVPATSVGQRRILLLDSPEHGRPTSIALSYDTQVVEREMLRFHCAEALRNGDYAGAYGLASRASNQRWSKKTRSRLGPLLDFPGPLPEVNGSLLPPFALTACQVEARLCMGDIAGALVRFGTLLDSSVWELIGGDARIRGLGLRPDRGDEALVGQLRDDHALLSRGLLAKNREEQGRYRVKDLIWGWPDWLLDRDGGQIEAARALVAFRGCFAGSPRRFRNLLVHGATEFLDLGQVERAMKDTGLIDGLGQPFGSNCLSSPAVADLLSGLGAPDLKAAVGGHLQDILALAIEG